MSDTEENIHKPGESVTDWRTALRYLKDGNRRYLEGRTIVQRTSAADREALKDAQKPFAVIVTCSDSRVVPEIYFDQKSGDIFVARNAGHTATPNALGTVEFAVQFLNVPLVMIVGHSQCGAVIGAMRPGISFPENLQSVIDAIAPVVEHCKDIDEAIRVNINHVVNKVGENPVVQKCGARVLGAYYDILTGEVTVLSDT